MAKAANGVNPYEFDRADQQHAFHNDGQNIRPMPGFTYVRFGHGDNYCERDSHHVWPTKKYHQTQRADDGSAPWAWTKYQRSYKGAADASRNSNQGVGGSTTTEGECTPPESIETKGKLLRIELELTASLALENVSEVSTCTKVDAAVDLAKLYLSCPSGSSLSASLALHEVSNAISEISGSILKEYLGAIWREAGSGNLEPSPARTSLVPSLVDAEKALRDLVVCRCQLATEFGVRELFVRELQKVFDYTNLDENKFSKLMHCHKRIFGDWPGVFQPPRPPQVNRRKKPKNRKTSAPEAHG